MAISKYDLVTLLHGLAFGGFFLMAVYALGYQMFSDEKLNVNKNYLFLIIGIGWIILLLGTYVIYPWYKANPEKLLLANPNQAKWQTFGMEWKEHVAWISVILISATCHILAHFKKQAFEDSRIRLALRTFLVVAFLSASVAGIFGALIAKFAPIHGGALVHLEGWIP